ncbi:Predicted nuclease of the RNAse H fold, HicB family [Bryocella elongata]|uniref:Predicted nuclease of the RNAse H fold, HicB family n=1 Tax=Bryocella elongata TaxID=863522 RepID=A0A1H5T8G7_9BACT|nr:type II toxin-antitoxin system HicB family antitoxin [Bryocella elongata]SEF59080.1 Predicted nuclease of the RNAse H fold, HicB family [Bryocella elongata]
MTRQYPVIYEWAGRNFSGYAPDVPGCVATAKTLPEMRSALKGALEAHLKWLGAEGEDVPAASDSVTVDMEPDAEFPQPRGYYVVVEKLNVVLPKPKASKPGLTQVKRSNPKRRALQAA